MYLVRADRGEEAIDQVIIFQRHAELAREPRLIIASSMICRTSISAMPAAAILRFHTERDQTRVFDPTLVVEKLYEPDRDSETR